MQFAAWRLYLSLWLHGAGWAEADRQQAGKNRALTKLGRPEVSPPPPEGGKSVTRNDTAIKYKLHERYHHLTQGID